MLKETCSFGGEKIFEKCNVKEQKQAQKKLDERANVLVPRESILDRYVVLDVKGNIILNTNNILAFILDENSKRLIYYVMFFL